MAICFPFIKYLYVFILFIFSFICLFSQTIEIVGFGSMFAVQCIYTIMILMDIYKDSPATRQAKSISIPLIKNPLNANSKTSIELPLYWLLLAGVSLQFTSATLMIMTCSYLYKKYQTIQLARTNRWRAQMYKVMFIIVTILMMIVTYSYMSDFNSGGTMTFSGSYRMIFIFCIFGILGLSSINVYYANQLSKLISTSTDG